MAEQKVSAVDYILTAAMLIVAVSFIVILYITFKNLCITSKLQQVLNKHNKWMAISAIICILFYSAHSFLLLISFIALLIEGEHITDDTITDRLNDLSLPLYAIGQWLTLLSFLLRIDLSFRHNVSLSYPRWFLYMLYVAIASMLILLVLFVYEVERANHTDDHSNAYLVSFLWAAMYLILSVLILYLFLRKIVIVMKQRLQQKQLRQTENDEESDNNVMIIEVDTVQNVVRYGLLVSICILSSIIGLFGGLATTYASHPQRFYGGSYLMFDIDALVNSLCLLFMFKFAKDAYYGCCKCGHSICEKCCVSCVVKSDHQQEQDYANLILK